MSTRASTRLVVQRLREKGHEAVSIAEACPGAPDDEVLALSRESGSILVTADKDFGELVFRLRLHHAGILLLRLPESTSAERANLVAAVIDGHGARLVGQFAVVSRNALRLRLPV